MFSVRIAIQEAAFAEVFNANTPLKDSFNSVPRLVEFNACTAEAILYVSLLRTSNPDVDTKLFNLEFNAVNDAINLLHM